MILLKTLAGAAAVAAVLPLPVEEVASFATIPQHDEWRSPNDPPSVSVSANGRYVAFASYAPLVPADTNRQRDVYVLDRTTGQVTLESATADGGGVLADSQHPRISSDGQRLVYQTNRATSSDWTTSHIVLRHRGDGTAKVITDRTSAAPARCWSHGPVISGDGRVVVFTSSTHLLPSATAGGHRQELYAYDVASASLRRALDMPPAMRSSIAPAISHDGRYIAFTSTAPGSPSQVLAYDTQRNQLQPIHAGGRIPNGASWGAAIDGRGEHVAFVSAATNLAPRDRNRAPDVFVADLRTGEIELVSRSAAGGSANGTSGSPALSADGRFVAFQSEASDLVCANNCTGAREDINLVWDVFLYDRATRTMSRVSAHGATVWMEASTGPSLDARADVIAFSSRHPIDGHDIRNDVDLFVRATVQNARLTPNWKIARESSWRLLSER